ncbi:hypothetical protein TRAPUB_7907 [Trametes pubescens]|uniref:Uncharacterized protein n=1 Tax=Trametes pubescens TaxID=154538 RepID=A0A1M2V244_TRAPU|nr:hypothetical protein TRAPUB_7907 [Trametes pubescens]
MKPPKSHARLNGWSLFLSELKGTTLSVPPGMDRFTHAAAMWHALPKAVRDDFKNRARVIRQAARRTKLQDHPSQNEMADDGGVHAAAQTIGGADVAVMRSPRRCAVRRLVRESEAVAFAGSFVIPRTRKSQHNAIPGLTTRGIDAFSSFSRRARST